MIRSLTALSLSPSQAIEVLTHSAIALAQQASVGGAAVDGLCDASDREEGGDVILWWNDLEKDKRYALLSPLVVVGLNTLTDTVVQLCQMEPATPNGSHIQ